ncbi:isoamylase early set domain-containing protein [Endozoicomonas sp. SCSIO W0465]|uniref:isoamylase early set domain-containing protein n=1 Tax=Endozoicomonas sp. SCSIO W0465 TaxID=2918516 RepID=UPI0020757EBA|nr:isoamylase early set domain-containing protein [Endozoicomonas sp. SCSIO W0465]USE35732.1 isoamylase early set domain-containing protein [Endozoicomonas sp. SCSIO W0465]
MLKKKIIKKTAETEVTFEFAQKGIKSVSLVADFNQWQPVTMKYHKKDKAFRTKAKLPGDGAFHFRYLLDDKVWENDHNADDYVPNPYGSDNSVVFTGIKK